MKRFLSSAMAAVSLASGAGADPGAPATHWSLRPLARPPVPAGPAHPIDAFVRAKLDAAGLTPSPEADRRTLIRRIFHDLTGLPPAPEEVDRFLAEPAVPDPVPSLVDRLLASPHHGERWARHWLDAIHFADTHGFEHDIARDHAWPYRDYVIAAMNRDTPWPRFIREQLAADAFFPDQPELTPALGFLGAGTFDLSAFSTAPVTFEYLDRDDLVTQTMAAFVSTTANCARCHAHKFDPISQEDYYALQAVFAGVLKGDVAYDADPAISRSRKRWQRLATAAAQPDPAIVLAPENEPLVHEWLAARGGEGAWRPLAIESSAAAEGSVLAVAPDATIQAGGSRPDKETYTLTLSIGLPAITALRLEVLASAALPMRGPGRQDNGNFHLSEIELQAVAADGAAPRPVRLARASADFNQSDWGIDRAIDGNPETAWGIHPAVGVPHEAVFVLAETLTPRPGEKLVVALKQLHGRGHVIGRFRLTATGEPPDRVEARPPPVSAAIAKPPADRTAEDRLALAAHALASRAAAEMAALPAPGRVFAAGSTVELVNGESAVTVRSIASPKPVHVLQRGDFDKPGAPAAPGALTAITSLPARFTLANPADEAARRAALADWIAHPDNPLTWRSVVNRFWHHHFGRGLCDTPGDFGKMGGTPSHPELLDWLAVWFRDDARGSLKQLHKLIVTSAAYRRTSAHRPEAAAIDEDNRLLWRHHRRRLDAESFRDFVLVTTGRLDPTMGGPGARQFSSVKGPQLTPAIDYAGFDWDGPAARRRSIYRFVWRGLADPFFESLDFPDLGLLAPARGTSVSSLQALTLYNNDFVLHHSAALADRVSAEAGTTSARVARAVQLVWLRSPTPAEERDFTGFAQSHGFAAFARLLFNSNEFLFVD